MLPNKSIIIIPARLKSKRLPRKPLLTINNDPMILHVWRRSVDAKVGPVIVACADKEIADIIQDAGGKAIMTDPQHSSGSDRIYEALQIIDPNMEYDTVINIQGDLPAIESNTIKCTLTPLKNKDVGIATLAFRIIDDEDFNNSNIVKVKILLEEGRPVGRAIDFSRIMKKEKNCYHHVGVCAFRRKILERFHSLQVSEREKTENLEQFRALDNNIRIDVALIDKNLFGIDTLDDLERIRKIL